MARKVLIQIEVENVGAARRLEALREEIRRLNKEIKGAEIGTPVYNELIARITDAKQEAAKLKEEQKALNREFKAAQVPKDSLAGLRIEYSKLTEQIRVLSATERQSAFGQSLIKNAAGVKREIDGIEQSLGRFTGNVGNYKSAFASLAQIVSGGLIGGGLVLTVNALTNSFTKGLTSLQDYGKGLSRLSAITGVTGAALDDLEERARGLTTIQIVGSQIVNTSQQIFEAFTLVGSARPELLKDAAALEEVTKQAIILSKASGDDLSTSVAAITAALAQFQLKAGDSADVINLLAAGSKVGKVEIPGLTESITRLGPTAKLSNVSLGETVALFETMADNGLEGERAAVGLRNILVKLSAAEGLPKAAQDAFREAGVNVKILSDRTLPLSERLTELSKIANNVPALNAVFDVQNIDTAAILGNNVKQFIELTAAVQGTDEAYKQAGINADNAAQRFANLEAKGVNLLTNAFLGIEPAITAVVDLLSGLVDILGEAPEFVSDNAKELAALGFVLLAFTRTAQTAVASTTAMTASQLSWAVALRGASVAQAISTAATEAMTAAMNALPLIAIVAGVYAIAKAFEAYENSASASEKATRAVADAQQEIASETAKEVSAIERNIEILKSETASKGLRKKAIDELLKVYPDYLKGIDLEKASIAQLTQIQDDLTASIYASSIARQEAAADEKLVEQRIKNEQKLIELQESLVGTSQNINKERGASAAIGGAIQQESIIRTREQIAALEKENEKIEQQREIQKQQFAELRARLTGELPTQQLTKVTDFSNGLSVSFGKAADSAKALSGETGEAGVSIDNTISGLKAQIDSLNKELESTPIGSARFKEIQEEIGRLQSRLDAFSTKKARSEADAQAGSIAALRAEISKLEKQIEATAPEPQLLTPLIQKLNEAQGELEKASLLLEELKNRAAGGVKIEAELAPLPTLAVPSSVKAQSEADKIKVIQKDLSDNATKLLKKQEEERADAAAKEKARQEELADLARESAFQAAETISNSVFEIQRNRLEQQTQLQIDQLDIETQARIAAAKGNDVKIAAIEKDSQKKREAIEKAAAEKRKQIAITEAIINTALAVTKALTGAPPPANLILAGVALAAGVAQQAVIRSQEFAEGGVADIKKLESGIIKERPNVPRTAKGDDVLAYVKNKEMVLNLSQQKRVREEAGMDIFARAGVPGEAATRHYGGSIREMFGQDAFALAGVPGESATRRGGLPGFASGGIVGIVPQNGFAQQTTTQAITVQAKAEFTPEQVAALGGTLGTIIGELVERGAFNGTLLGNDEANRAAERQAAMTQNRQG